MKLCQLVNNNTRTQTHLHIPIAVRNTGSMIDTKMSILAIISGFVLAKVPRVGYSREYLACRTIASWSWRCGVANTRPSIQASGSPTHGAINLTLVARIARRAQTKGKIIGRPIHRIGNSNLADARIEALQIAGWYLRLIKFTVNASILVPTNTHRLWSGRVLYRIANPIIDTKVTVVGFGFVTQNDLSMFAVGSSVVNAIHKGIGTITMIGWIAISVYGTGNTNSSMITLMRTCSIGAGLVDDATI